MYYVEYVYKGGDEEVQVILDKAEELGIKCAVADLWAKGGEGAIDLAHKVIEVAESNPPVFDPMYDWSWDVKKKIETLATKMYGAEHVDYSPQAKKDLKKISDLGLDQMPICIAKTQKSLSDNPALLGRPKDFIITVREIEIASGAGFLIPITGSIMRMPGLPARPASETISIDNDGNITGLM